MYNYKWKSTAKIFFNHICDVYYTFSVMYGVCCNLGLQVAINFVNGKHQMAQVFFQWPSAIWCETQLSRGRLGVCNILLLYSAATSVTVWLRIVSVEKPLPACESLLKRVIWHDININVLKSEKNNPHILQQFYVSSGSATHLPTRTIIIFKITKTKHIVADVVENNLFYAHPGS